MYHLYSRCSISPSFPFSILMFSGCIIMFFCVYFFHLPFGIGKLRNAKCETVYTNTATTICWWCHPRRHVPLTLFYNTIECTVHITIFKLLSMKFSEWYSVLFARCVFNIYFLLSPLISFCFRFSFGFLYVRRCIHYLLTFICSPMLLCYGWLKKYRQLAFISQTYTQIVRI